MPACDAWWAGHAEPVQGGHEKVFIAGPTPMHCVAGPDPTAQSKRQHMLRVLVVDDVDINRELLQLFIKQQGHVAEQADGGAAAVARVAAGGIDLVFMDVCMPDVDGLEATRRIRQLGGAASRTPVWAVTAQALPHHVAECLDAGMNGHFSKPVNLPLLRGFLDGLRAAHSSGGAPSLASGA